jgi:predicted DNA-binding transcriptional regulator AlpA
MENQNKLIDEHKAAEHLGVSLSTLRRDRASNYLQIPLVRLGGSVRYRIGDLDKWVNDRITNTQPPVPQSMPATPAAGRSRGRPRKVLMPA